MAQKSGSRKGSPPKKPKLQEAPKAKKAEPRLHHYLAQNVLLKHFQRPDKPGQIYRYDRRSKKIVSSGLKGVGSERDLYTVPTKEGEPDYRVETELFGTLDSGLAPLIDRLNAPLPPFLLKPSLSFVQASLVDLATFVAYQMQRTPGAFNQLEDASHEMMKKVMQMTTAMDPDFAQSMRSALKKDPEFKHQETSDEDIETARQMFLEGSYDLKSDGKYYMGLALKMAYRSVPIFLMKELEIWKVPEGKAFLTSDWPVLKITNSKDPPLYRGGLLSAHVYFPIGSKTALFFRTVEDSGPPKSWDRLIEVPVGEVRPELVDRLNAKMVSHAEFTVLGSYYDEKIQAALTATPKPVRFKVG